jgi:hypothetical protein
MVILEAVNFDIQYTVSVKPTLTKFARLVQEEEDRNIFSFDRVHAREVIGALRKADSGLKGVLELPKLMLIGLVSEYDVFLHQLIRTGLTVQEDAVGSINRTLSLKEILTFSDIKDATNHLIEKEIDSILHEDHHEQLLAISKLFNIKIDTDDSCVRDFLEICERRNLFTHNAGVANHRYLTKCSQFRIPRDKIKMGDELSVNRDYFQKAITTTQELSIKLVQFVWRKLLPKEK